MTLLGSEKLTSQQHGCNADIWPAIILLADAASLSLPPLECCLGTRPTQAEKSRPERNWSRTSDTGDQGGGESRTDAGDLVEPFARLMRAVPPSHPSFQWPLVEASHGTK